MTANFSLRRDHCASVAYMSGGTNVRSLAVSNLDLPLHEPFGISGGAQNVAANLLVAVELADGTVGFGEAAPFPAFNGETRASTMAAIESVRSAVEGADVRSWRGIAELLRARIPRAGAARCAIETAVLDALTRRAKMPLWAFFGGALDELTTDFTITTGSIETARASAARIAGRGFRTIKVKVGAAPHHDAARLEAIHEAAPSCCLVVDANAAFDAETALELCAAMASLPVTLLEQPVGGDDLDGLSRVTRATNIPVAADETLTSLERAWEIARTGAAGVLNIKIMKCGIAEALDIAAVARAAGLRLMIGGMVESILAMSTSACLAAGLGGFGWVDLDTPMFLAENPFTGGFVMDRDRILLAPIQTGHGVTPRSPSAWR